MADGRDAVSGRELKSGNHAKDEEKNINVKGRNIVLCFDGTIIAVCPIQVNSSYRRKIFHPLRNTLRKENNFLYDLGGLPA